jgi:5-formyltetrahydrofolate cyclo-ligase
LDKRKQILLARKNLENRPEKNKAIAIRLLPFLEGKNHIGLYLPIGSEVDVLETLLQLNKQYYAPACLNETQMEFRLLNTLKPGRFGILEPEGAAVPACRLEVILVPMVAFCGLHRMGHGAGYYDRYLQNSSALKIGLAFDEQQADFKASSWDVDMDVVITPTRVIESGEENVSI